MIKTTKHRCKKSKNYIYCVCVLKDNIKMIILKSIYRFITIPIKIPAGFFLSVAIDNIILNFIWKAKIIRIDKMVWKKKNQVGRFMLLDLKSYCEVTAIKTVKYLQKDRHKDE